MPKEMEGVKHGDCLDSNTTHWTEAMCRIKSITRELQQNKTTSESNLKSKTKIAGNLICQNRLGQAR